MWGVRQMACTWASMMTTSVQPVMRIGPQMCATQVDVMRRPMFVVDTWAVFVVEWAHDQDQERQGSPPR